MATPRTAGDPASSAAGISQDASPTLKNLGIYSDWVAAAKKANNLWPTIAPGEATRRKFREALHFEPRPATPIEVRHEGDWEHDGVAGEVISWSVGYGPRTEAWVLKPAGGGDKPLPGILALHDHGGFKMAGKEKIADGPQGRVLYPQKKRDDVYGGRAFANALAKRGYVVLVHDVFLWGSRRFPYETIPPAEREMAERMEPMDSVAAPEINRYNTAAAAHEHIIEKYCRVLGTTLAGIISYEDRVAMNYLLSRADVNPISSPHADKGGACIGLSGGGMRSVLLQSTTPEICAAVCVGAMCTYEGLLDHNVNTHTWMFFPSVWPLIGDWPDAAACRAPSPLMVQCTLQDPLYTVEGMKAADQKIAAHYRSAGAPQQYEGHFYPGLHKFDQQMQEDAFAFLDKHLKLRK